jgi:aspartyl aminopeptidase
MVTSVSSGLVQEFNQKLLSYIKHSPSPFHATSNSRIMLLEEGFSELSEGSKNWDLKKGGKYFITKNDSSIVAFKMGNGPGPSEEGFKVVGAHTDSPCLKLRPRPDLGGQNGGGLTHYTQLGVEVYGGVILSTWFDRDLSLAGKVMVVNSDGKLEKVWVDFKRPIAYLPNVAIHLSRDVNENRSINKQKELPVITGLFEINAQDSNAGLKFAKIIQENLGTHVERVLSWDLYFYDCQPPSLVGVNQEFLASARLDNLLSCFVATSALINSSDERPSLIVLNDHEEVGSETQVGADGPFLKNVWEKVVGKENFSVSIHNSLMISSDNAHGIHPNYPEKHDPQHSPVLNGGPALKVNANQRYATHCGSWAVIELLAKEAGVPLQYFTSRGDMPCGSTIGPITSRKLGLDCVDIGVPTFAMHSVRELAGSKDPFYLFQLFKTFFQTHHDIP